MKKLTLLISLFTCHIVLSQEYIAECRLYGNIKCDSINNSLAKFKGGDDDVYKYLFKKLPELKKVEHEHSVDIWVNEKGKVTKAVVSGGRASCAEHMKDIETCLLNMPKWVNAKKDSKPIATKEHIIRFSYGEKVKDYGVEIIAPPAEPAVYSLPPEPEVYFITETPAEFPGGIEKYKLYLEDAAKDFEYCKKDSSYKPCKIFFKFVVDKNGRCIDNIILKSQCVNCPGIETKVNLLVAKMPLWTPAVHEGKIVKAYVQSVIRLK